MSLPLLDSVCTLLNDRSVCGSSSTRSGTRLQKGVYNWVCDHNQKFSEEFFQGLSLINFEKLRWSGLTGSKIVFVFPLAIQSQSAVSGRIFESFICATLRVFGVFSGNVSWESRKLWDDFLTRFLSRLVINAKFLSFESHCIGSRYCLLFFFTLRM